MDQPLNSSRDRRDYSSGGGGGSGSYGPSSSRRPYHHHSHGGSGGGRHGRGRRNYAPYPPGGRGGHRPPHHHRSDRGGGGNRFFAEPPLPMDATSVALRNVTHMLYRLGHWDDTYQQTSKRLLQEKPSSTHSEGDTAMAQDGAAATAAGDDDDDAPPTITLHDLVQTQRQNIESLTAVIVKKPDVFLSFETEAVLQMMASSKREATHGSSSRPNDDPANSTHTPSSYMTKLPPPISAHALAGPLATSLLHTTLAASPLATPVYAGLARALAKADETEGGGVAARLLQLSVYQFAADLDTLWLVAQSPSSSLQLPPTRTAYVQARAAATRRIQAVLRFWCGAAAAGVLDAGRSTNGSDDNDQDPVPTAVQELPLTLAGVLRALLTAAEVHPHASTIMGQPQQQPEWILRSLQPYVVALLGQAWWDEHVSVHSTTASVSNFAPGLGAQALLLPTEQASVEDEEEDDDEEEEEDEEDQVPAKVCDSAQELAQALDLPVSENPASVAHQVWATPPWTAASEGSDEVATGPSSLRLSVYPTCQSLTLLLGGHWQSANPDPLQPTLATTSLVLPWDDDGVVVGRLPIFGSPSTGSEDAQEEEDEGPVHPRLMSYRKNYSALDRVTLADAMRDVLVSHQLLVTETGVTKGSLKAMAEQVWSLRHVHASPGMEYLMVQVILALVCQVPPQGTVLGHSIVSLSRVLVELTKLEASLFPNVLVQAVHILVEHYMPALTPLARHNLSQWFALHLIAFQCQWPAQYWQHWQSYLQRGWTDPRGAFLLHTLQLVLENTSTPVTLLRQNPHWQGVWTIVSTSTDDDGASNQSLLTEVANRMHDVSEDPVLLLQYLRSEEVVQSIADNTSPWIRTRVVGRALAYPLAQQHARLVAQLHASSDDNTTNMQDGESPDETEDVLSTVLEVVTRYESLVLGILQAETVDGNNVVDGEIALLSAIYSQTSFSSSCVEATFRALLELKAVSPMGMTKWALGWSSAPVLRWWEWAGMALRKAVSLAASDSDKMDESVDDAPPPGVEAQVAKLVEVLGPILDYIIPRIAKVIEEDVATNPIARKPSSTQVDAVEGTKYAVCLAHSLFLDRLWGSWKDAKGADPLQEMREALDRSTIGKEALSELLASSSDGSAPKPIGILRDTLLNL